uniref:Uncharacterized protein n=1 Tax=Cannabis sativa TaxID=3483 RepID=A0A803R124_CANSA
MDFIGHPFRFSSPSLPSFGNFIERVKEFCTFAVSAILGNIFSAIFTFFFALGLYFLSLFGRAFLLLLLHDFLIASAFLFYLRVFLVYMICVFLRDSLICVVLCCSVFC